MTACVGATQRQKELATPDNELLARVLPHFASRAPVIVLVRSTNGTERVEPSFLDHVHNTLLEALRGGGFGQAQYRLWDEPMCRAANATSLGNAFVSDDGSAAAFFVMGTSRDVVEARQLAHQASRFLANTARSLAADSSKYTIGVTGEYAMADETRAVLGKEVVVVAAVAFAAAAVGVAVATNSLASVVLTGSCLLLCTALLYAAMVLVSQHVHPLHAATPVLALLLEAVLCSAFLLVLLHHFAYYGTRGSHTSRAMTRAMKAAAQGVCMATACVAAPALAVLIVVRSRVLFWHHAVLLLAVLLPALCVLTFVPALVALCGSFFALRGLLPCVRSCREPELRQWRKKVQEQQEADSDDSAVDSGGAEVARIRSSFLVYLYSLASKRDWHSSLVIVVAIALLSSLVVQIADIALNNSRAELAADNAPAVLLHAQMRDAGFGGGLATPFFVLQQSADGSSPPQSHSAFRSCAMLLQRVLATHSFLSTRSAFALSYLRERLFTWDTACQLLDPQSEPGRSELGVSYRALVDRLVSGNTTVAVLAPNTDAGDAAAELLPSCERFASSRGPDDTTVTVVGVARDEHEHTSAALVAYAIGAPIALVLVVLAVGGIARAPFVPFAFLVVGVLTAASALGAAVLVFGSASSTSDGDGLSPAALLLALPMLLGHALAGNALFHGIVARFRSAGFNTESSVLRAVFVSRGMLPAQAAVVALCFAPLLFSAVPALREVGTLFVVHAALDYVLGKLVLAPTVALLWGNSNWWPQRLLTIYRKPAVVNNGSLLIRYMTNSREAEEDDEDDEREFEEQMQRERDRARQQDRLALLKAQAQFQHEQQQMLSLAGLAPDTAAAAAASGTTVDDFDPMELIDPMHEETEQATRLDEND